MTANEDLAEALDIVKKHAPDDGDPRELQRLVVQELKAFSPQPRDQMVELAGRSAGKLARKGVGPIQHSPHRIVA